MLTHKLSGTKGGLSGPKAVPRPLLEPKSAHSYRQLPVYIRRGDEVGPSMCPTMENPYLVLKEAGDSQSMHIPGLGFGM